MAALGFGFVSPTPANVEVGCLLMPLPLPPASPLAAIGFSDPVMLIGMLAGAIPIALHLLHRIRSPIVPFPTLRFLKITALKTSRRRQLQQWFLLFLRVALFGLIAMAIAQPLIGGGSAALAYGLIACFLVGAGLLVLATVYGASALDQSKSRAAAPTTASPMNTGEASPSPSPSGRSWAWCAALLILGVTVLAYASFGLASDRFFTAQSGRYSGRSTACVIILDNSYSMLARQDSRSRWQLAAEQVRQLLADNIAPAEVAILPTN
ncbi:MAG: BatA domain-containing protein, partial [Phycisphaerae bacterium]